METRDDIDIHNFDLCNLDLSIKHTLLLYYYIQVNIKVPYYTIQAMAAYSYKRYSEVSSEELFSKKGIGMENAVSGSTSQIIFFFLLSFWF